MMKLQRLGLLLTIVYIESLDSAGHDDDDGGKVAGEDGGMCVGCCCYLQGKLELKPAS